MEYPLLNYTAQRCPSDQTLIEVFSARGELAAPSCLSGPGAGHEMALAEVAKQLWDILAGG